MPAHIFLSYSRLDTELALRLAADLKNAGVHLWMDRFDLKPGDDWRLEIQKALDNCAAVVVLLSPDYVSTPYCLRELARADAAKRLLVSVLSREVRAEDWPIEVQREQYADFRNWRDKDNYRVQFTEVLSKLKQQAAANIGAIPDIETRYLTNLIADLEARKGVLAYVELSASIEAAEASGSMSRLVEAWGLEGVFNLLEDASPSGLPEQKRKIPLDNVHEVLKRCSQFVLIGAPGAGKTTTIQRLALDAARERLQNPRTAPLPLLLYLPDWSDEISPIDFVRSHWPFEADPTALLNGGDVLLYMDGLNEMGASGLRKVQLLRDWLSAGNGPQHVIITCRASDYAGDLDLHLPTVLVEEMDDAHIRKFVTAYLGENSQPLLEQVLPNTEYEKTSPWHLFRLARNPFLLTALIVLHKSSPDGQLPRNRGVLFRQLVNVLWEREHRRQTPGWVQLPVMETALSRLAFTMLTQQTSLDIPTMWACRKLGRGWRPKADAKRFALTLLQVAHSANLMEVRGDKVRFYHQLIAEYFAAVRLAKVGFNYRLLLLKVRWYDIGKLMRECQAFCTVVYSRKSTQLLCTLKWVAAVYPAFIFRGFVLVKIDCYGVNFKTLSFSPRRVHKFVRHAYVKNMRPYRRASRLAGEAGSFGRASSRV